MIPNHYHFIFGLSEDFGGKPFSLIHYLAVASCHAINSPDQMNLYYAYEPSGVWWERAKPYLNLIRVTPPNGNSGNGIHHFAHKADLLRLMILIEQGGIYLDLDVISLRCLSELRTHELVMGEEYGVGLCNAVILARRGAKFLQQWLAEYSSFSNDQWNFHSVRLPAALAKQMPEAIHILDHTKFFWPMYWPRHLTAFFLHPGSHYCWNSFCVHLWERLTWPYVCRLTPSLLWSIDCEFSRIVRQYIDPSWCVQDESPDCFSAYKPQGAENSDQARALSDREPAGLKQLHDIEMAIAALPANCREAVILCGLQMMATTEAAALLQRTVEDVESALAKGSELMAVRLHDVRR